MFSARYSAELIGKIHNSEQKASTLIFHVHFDKNCERILKFQPSLYFRSVSAKDIELARAGLFLLLTSIILGVARIGAAFLGGTEGDILIDEGRLLGGDAQRVFVDEEN